MRDVCFLGCACECSPTEEPILPTRPTHRPFGPVGYTRITSAYIYLYSWHLSTRFHIHTPETFSKKEKKETRTTSKTKKKLTITPYNIVTYQHRLLKVELGLGWPLCKLIFNIHSIYSHYISTIRKRHGLSIDILLQVWTLNPPKKNKKWKMKKKGPILWFFKRYLATREQRSAKKSRELQGKIFSRRY